MSAAYSIAKQRRKWVWVAWASASDIHPSSEPFITMRDALGHGTESTADEARAAALHCAPGAGELGADPASGYVESLKQRDHVRTHAFMIARDIEHDARLVRLAAGGAHIESMRVAYNLTARSPIGNDHWPRATFKYAMEILRGEHAADFASYDEAYEVGPVLEKAGMAVAEQATAVQG